MRQSYETRESLDSLLDEGRYQEFLDAAANIDESDVAEIVCNFARRLIDRVPELGFIAMRDLIEDFRERVVKASLSSQVRSRFNSTIRDFVGRTNAMMRIREVQEYSRGTRQVTQPELIRELNQILALSPRKAREAYRELVGSIALNSLPPGICSTLKVTLLRFSMENVKEAMFETSRKWS